MAITLMIATVRIEPGWAVGAVALSDPAIDRDILLDASGLPWIPGSALAGSLRAHLAAADPPADVRLMGSRPPANQAESARSTVSPLWVQGAFFSAVAPPGGPPAQGILDTVGQTAIDRTRGAAAPGSLRFSRLAASGGTLTVYLRHDPGGHPLSAADLQLIAGWRPAIGRDRTRGGGRAQLVELRHGTVAPATPEGATTWLTHGGPELFEAVVSHAIAGAPEARPWLEAEFEIIDGLLIGGGPAGHTARSRRQDGRPLIPGSAWKGVVRSRTEFIVRSRYGQDAACQVQTGCGSCVVCAVFGHRDQRGMLAFRDSYIDNSGTEIERTQVGIDRVTGGSRDALLFKTAPVPAGRLQLSIDSLGDVEPWVRNTVRHVLRDISDGLMGVGSSSTRGLGTLRLLDPPSKLEPVVIPALETPANQELRT